MIAVGDEAPDFEGTTQTGERLRLASLRGAPVVLYFFPRASSPGCTREAVGFARLDPALRARGARVVGVSVDPIERQARFVRTCSLPFPLVADADGTISRTFGVLGLLGLAKRVTFLLDERGRVTERVESFLPGPHVAAVERRFAAAPPK